MPARTLRCGIFVKMYLGFVCTISIHVWDELVDCTFALHVRDVTWATRVVATLKNQWLRLKHVYRTGPSMKVVVNRAPFWSRCDDHKSASLSISTFLIVVKKNFLNPLLINFLELKRTEMVTCSQRTTRPCRSNFCAIVWQLMLKYNSIPKCGDFSWTQAHHLKLFSRLKQNTGRIISWRHYVQ